MKYVLINIIASGSALSNPVKLTLGQRPPLSIIYDTVTSEQDNEPSYKKSDFYNNKDNNDVHLNNYDVITKNVDVIHDDTNKLLNFETDILNNVESSEFDDSETVSNKNKDKTREERELANINTNLTAIHLAGYDDEIFQIKQDIQNKGTGKELLICFYLCNDLHYNDLGCLYTDIDILQNVLLKYSHYFCVDNESLKPTWSLDDIVTTYNFPNRKEIKNDNVQVKNIDNEMSDIEEDKKERNTKSNSHNIFNDKPHEIRKYYPKIIYPNENDLNGIDINLLKRKLKGQNITGENVNMRYLDPKYYSKKKYLEPAIENTVNTLERERNQNCLPLYPGTIANTMTANDIKHNIDDGNNLTHINIDHSVEPNIIFEPMKNKELTPNTNKNENNDKLEILKAETLEVIEDSIQNLFDVISTSSSADNILQYGNNSISQNNIVTNANYTNNTDDRQNNGTFNDSIEILSDDNLMNFTGGKTNKLGPPNVEIIVEDNPLYDKHMDTYTYKPKLDDVTLTAIYDNSRIPPILYNNSQNIFIPSILKEAEAIFKQPEHSVDTTEHPNNDQTVNLLENNAQNKQLNIPANKPYMYNFINRQSNHLKPHVTCHIKHNDPCVSIYPISDPKNNIASLRFPPSYFKLNRKTDDSLTSVVNEKYPLVSGFCSKLHYSPKKLTPDLTLTNKLKPPTKFPKAKEERGNRLPSYQNSDAKNHPIKKVDVRISPQKWSKCPKITDCNSLPMIYYPRTDKDVIGQSNNEIKPLNEHYKCSIPQDTSANLKNNYYFDTQKTNVKEIKWDHLKIPPDNNVIKKYPQKFSKKINKSENINYPIYIDNCGKYDVIKPTISKNNMFKNNNQPVSQIQRNVWPVDLNLKEIKNHVTNVDSPTLRNFYTIGPTLPYKPYSVLKKISSNVPTILSSSSSCTINKPLNSSSFDFTQVAPDFLKTKPELKRVPKISAAIDLIPSSYPTKCFPNLNLGIISTDPRSRQLQNQQYLKNPQPKKNFPLHPISYANSKKVNFSSKYRFPLELTYNRTNKKKLKFPHYITSVSSSLNFKSILKTSIILPNKNDLRFPLNPLCPFGVPCSKSYSPTKSVPIASLYTKSVFDYKVTYDLSQYKFPYNNSLLVKYLDGKIYPYYYTKSIILYLPKSSKTILKAPINYIRLVSPIPTSKDPDRLLSMLTSPIRALISKIFPFPMSSLPISSNKAPLTDSLPIPISSKPVKSCITSSTLQRGPISFPASVQSSPICSNIDRRLNGYSIPYSSLQPSSNDSSKLFYPPISYLISSPCTVLRSPLPPLPLPILTNKELLTDSVPLPISSLPTSSWPVSLTIPTTISEPKTISAFKFLPDSSKPDLSSKGFPVYTSSLPILSNKEPETTVYPFPISPLPVSSWPSSPASQRRLKTVPIPVHFLPISFTPNHRSKGYPASTSSLPITTNLNQNLKGLAPLSLPTTSNKCFNLKSFPTSSFLPVSSNTDSSSKGFPLPMPSLPITSSKKEGTKRPPPYLPISPALDREPETFPVTFKSLPCSNLDQNIKGIFPRFPCSPISYYKPKTNPTFVQPLPVSSNICLKGFPAPISSSPFPSPLEVVPITSPVSNSYPLPLPSKPILSNKEVVNKICSNPISSSPVSSPCPMLSTLEIEPKIYRKPMQYLPISSNKYCNLKDFSIPVQYLPTSSPLKAVPKKITSPILSLPFSSTLEVAPENILLPHSSLHIPSTLKIESVPSSPTASDIGFQPRYITPSLPVSSNLGIKPKIYSEHIQSMPCLPNSSNLNSEDIQSPVSYLPFSLNKDPSLKGFSPTSGITSKVFSAPIQDLPIASNLYLSQNGYLPSSRSELKPKTLPKPCQTLPVSSTINPCLEGSPIPVISLPVSPTLEDTPISIASPCLPSSSLTNEIGPKNLLTPFLYLPVPSTNRIKSKQFPPPVPSLPISSAIKFQPKSIPHHTQPLLISPNKDSIKGIPLTKLFLPKPLTLNLKPKDLPTPNQSMPFLSNNICWKVFPSRISPLPTSFPLELEPKTCLAPIESMPNSPNIHTSSRGYPCPVSPLPGISNRNPNLKSFPKHITPYLTLPLLKRTEIDPISPFNLSTLQEPCRTEKDQSILAENMGLRYPHNATSSPNVFYLQPNSILLKPYLNIYDKPRNISYYTNRPVSTPQPQEITSMDPTSSPIISNNPLYQPFNPYSSKVKNPSKPYFISQDKVLSNPVPYPLISNNPPSQIIPNSYSNPYEQNQYYPNFKPMPRPQSAVLNNTLPNPFIGNIPSPYPFKAKPKINFPMKQPKQQKTYLYYYTINPQSGSNLLQNQSSESKLKSINLPTRSNLKKLYNKPFFKSTITTPTALINTDTEEDKTYTTFNVKNDLSPTQEYLQPTDIYTPTFASKFEPIDSKSKSTSTLQSLIAPSRYKEKLIKVSPYNSKPPIQSSNEEFIPDSLPCRKTQTKFDRKYPQYPTEFNNPIQRNLNRITTTEVPKFINKIEYIHPKLKPPSCVCEKLYNKSNSINQPINEDSFIIPVGIAEYEPNKLNKFNIKTNDPNIELRAWLSKLTVLKPKIVFDEVEITTLNFVPIVKDIAYKPEVIQDTVKRYVERYYGNPIILKGIYSFCQPYQIDDVTRTIYIIWPTIYKCIKNC